MGLISKWLSGRLKGALKQFVKDNWLIVLLAIAACAIWFAIIFRAAM